MRNGQRFGPVAAHQLKALAAAGQLLPTDLVWREGMADWRPASQCKGLFSATPPAAIPVAVPANAPQPGGRQPVPLAPRPGAAAGRQQKKALPRWVIAIGTLGVLGIVGLVGIVIYFVVVWAVIENPSEQTYVNDVYRIAPGEYELTNTLVGETGVKASEPVALVPSARIATQNFGLAFPVLTWTATEGVTVERIEAGKPPEVRSFNQAVGFGGWLKFEPVHERVVRVQVNNLTDNLTETGREAHYILHVPKGQPALVTGTKTGVESALNRITSRPGAAQAMLRLDDYAARLRKVFGADSGLVGEFADHMRLVEAAWLSGSGDPGPLVEKQIDAFVSSVTESDSRETLYLLSVVHGDALAPEQVAAARKLLGVPIAEGYSAGPAAPPAGPAALLCCLAVDELPDDFVEIVHLLHWVSESVRGPIIVREWDVGNIHYIEYLYEIEKGEEIGRYVLQKFRQQQKDLSAATRLRNAIESAAGGHGADQPAGGTRLQPRFHARHASGAGRPQPDRGRLPVEQSVVLGADAEGISKAVRRGEPQAHPGR
jgi:hypothetical protein